MTPFQLGFQFAGNPLGTPSGDTQGSISLLSSDALSNMLRQFEVHASIALTPGEHAINATGRSAKFGIPNGTSAKLSLAVQTRQNELCLDRVEIRFSQPIRLLNIFTTIDELSALVAESPGFLKSALDVDLSKNELISKASSVIETNAKKYAEIITDTNAWKFLKEAAERNHISENIEKSKEYSKKLLEIGRSTAESALEKALGNVSLSALEIRGTLEENTPKLVFVISGDVEFNAKLKRSFVQYTIPDVFLPNFDPRLTRLLNQFCLDGTQGSNLSRTLLAMIADITGTLEATAALTPLPFELQLHDNSRISALIHTHRIIKISAEYDIGRVAQYFAFDARAKLSSHGVGTSEAHLSMQATPDAMVALGQHFNTEAWTASFLGHGQDILGRLEFGRAFQLFPELIEFSASFKRIKPFRTVRFHSNPVSIQGTVDWGIDNDTKTLHIHTFSLDASGHMHLIQDGPFQYHGCTTDIATLEGEVRANAVRKVNGETRIRATSQLAFDLSSLLDVTPIPELGLSTKTASLNAEGVVNLDLHTHCDNANDAVLSFDLNNSSCQATCRQFEFVWDRLRIASQTQAVLDLLVRNAACSIAGISASDIGLSWQLGRSPQILFDNHAADLLPDELCLSNIDATLSQYGILKFHHGKGFYNADFFNAILQPNENRAHWLVILQHKPLYKHLEQLCQAIVFPRIHGSEDFYRRGLRWVERCQNAGIFSAAELIHPETLAKALSWFLFEDERATDDILPSVRRVMAAEGIDRFKIEELLERAFPNANLEDAGRILKWLHHLFSPVPYQQPQITSRPALCDDPGFLPFIEELPSPNDIYDGDWSTQELPRRVYKFATGLSIETLDWILQHRAENFPDDLDIRHLQTLLDVKRKIRHFEPREGTFIIQDFNISVFLRTLLDGERALLQKNPPSDSAKKNGELTDAFRTWLAPADVAQLICAGISSRLHGMLVQINQAQLFEYLQSRGTFFARAVFYEIGQHSTRVLISMLLSWLSQDQSFLIDSVDRATALSNLLDIPVPHIDDFAPWGQNPGASYMNAIIQTAESINQANDLYSAAILKMQSYRSTPRVHIPQKEAAQELITRLQAADSESKNFVGKNPDDIPDETRQHLQTLWTDVFTAARIYGTKNRETRDVAPIRPFVQRLFEALRIASVDDDIIHQHDEAPRWFAHKNHLSKDQIQTIPRETRLRYIIQNLYPDSASQQIRTDDPLTWFLPAPPKGHVDLTLVTSMGIINAGNKGHELETVLQRLQKSRGIHTVRTNTGNIQPLDYNANRIIEAIEPIQTPFAIIGYSQGCANMMRAESRLMASTPDNRQKLEKYLISRHFVCSAFNGTPHAVCGVDKYHQLLVEGEAILKSLSTTLSKPLSSKIFTSIKRILDTNFITASLSSVEALSPIGLAALARDAQYAPNAVSFETLGVQANEQLPEGLVLMGNHFDKQAHIPNDSQVGVDSAHAYPVFNHNNSVDILQTQTVPSDTLDIHHWGPLIEEVRFLESPLDIQNCAYKGPKSIYITPWIDTLICLGFLPVRSQEPTEINP